MNLSLNYYLQENFVKCIELSRKVVEIDPQNHIAYNNMCASFNNLGRYEEAKAACEKALKLSPDFELAKNNLKLANNKLNEILTKSGKGK